MKPTLSIVLCTYNNANSLQLTLAQLAQQQVSDAQTIEIVVVNNNSTDFTEEVVAPFLTNQNIPFRYLVESRQGLSHARNTGLHQAQGSYILFTDDDADIPAHWANRYLQIIQQLQPDCLYSRIDVIWDQPKPWWYLPEYNSYFVGLNYGDSLLHVTDIHKEFYGKNFCVRKSLLQEFGGFDPKLGRHGITMGVGDETLIYRHLVTGKKKIIYFPDATVGHRLKPREYTQANIKKLFIDGAHSHYHIARLMARKKIMDRPLRFLVDAVINLGKSLVQLPLWAVSFNKPKYYYHYLCIRKNLLHIKLWISTS